MRLIDEDRFLEYMEEKCDSTMQLDLIILAIVIEALKEQPTAYDIDKVVEELEKLADESYRAYCISFNSDDRAEYDAYTNAIEIVKQCGARKDVE